MQISLSSLKRFLSNTILLLILLLAASCLNNSNRHAQAEPNFDWLLGEWVRTNDKENLQTYEYWSKISEIEYQGLGCTLQNQDTVFKEDIRLIKTDTSWNFVVYGVNEQPTPFVITNTTDSSFTCKNEKNDFPKEIRYTLINNQLEAEISAGEQKVQFLFKRLSSN